MFGIKDKEKPRMVEVPLMTCWRCGYEWIARTQQPKNCPQCHRPLNYHGDPALKTT
jgi:hypothetical protein